MWLQEISGTKKQNKKNSDKHSMIFWKFTTTLMLKKSNQIFLQDLFRMMYCLNLSKMINNSADILHTYIVMNLGLCLQDCRLYPPPPHPYIHKMWAHACTQLHACAHPPYAHRHMYTHINTYTPYKYITQLHACAHPPYAHRHMYTHINTYTPYKYMHY